MSGLAHPKTATDVDVRHLRVLYKLLAALSQASGLEDVFRAAIQSLLEATSANRAAILLFESDAVIRFKASQGLSSTYQQAVIGHSPWTHGERDARPIVIPDVNCEESVASYRDAFAAEGIRAVAFVPVALDAAVLGKFMLYYDRPHECSADELEISQAIAYHVALATEHKRAEQARRDSEQRLQAILENAGVPFSCKMSRAAIF